MTSHETAGVLRRALTALGSALKRGILGKSAHDYTKQFTGSDEYWDRVIAAQQGWPRQETPQPDAIHIRSSSDVVMRSGPSIRDTARRPPEQEYEPVHGWTRRQSDDYLARNPSYRSPYEAELQKRRYAAASQVNGSSLSWFGLWRINRDKAASDREPNGTQQARESQTNRLCGL
jgi:hypothetical protein